MDVDFTGKTSDDGSGLVHFPKLPTLLAAQACEWARSRLSSLQRHGAGLHLLWFGVFSQALYYAKLLQVVEHPHV